MIHFKKYMLLLVCLAALVAGCRKDSIDQSDTIFTPDPTVKIQAGVFGLVVDESGQPVEGATVQLGTAEVQTDDKGFFSISGFANQIQPFVRAEKAGFFPSLVSFSTKAGDMGRVTITLRTRSLAGQVAAASGGLVNVPGGGSIRFPDDGFVDASGQAYTGQVLVYATYLDPSQEQTDNMVPGSWQGRTATGERQVLRSYGMIHALLESPAGDKLQLKKSAQITVPVPADRLSDAPATIPLWYIDEATSIWVEEGSAELQGSVYSGKVSHFSWWNCDDGFPTVELSGILRIGSAHPYVEIRLTRPNGVSGTATPSAGGYFSGLVPANESLVFEVIDECGNVVYSDNIGPFTVDTDLGIISLDWTTDWVELSGTLLNCDQQPVTNGFIAAQTNAQATGGFPITINPVDGSFSGAIANCGGTEVFVTGYDFDAQKVSETITKPVSQQVDFGTLTACDQQLIPGVLIDFGNGTTKFVENITGALYSDPMDTVVNGLYIITAVDDQGNDNINTMIATILSEKSAPQLWLPSFQSNPHGNPVYYDVEDYKNEATIIQLGTQTGELVSFQITNVQLREHPANIVHPNCTITITAILE